MRILALSPHPDDLEFGCGGTLAKLATRHKIAILVMTEGQKGGSSRQRRIEQESSAKILKARLFWGGFSDTRLPPPPEVIQTIESVMKDFKPNLIFAPYFKDTHQDHRATAYATTTATRYARNVLFYEGPTTMNFVPSVFVDIGKVLPTKFRLLKAHRSQVFQTKVPGLSILEAAKSTSIFRGTQMRVKFAEGFVPYRLTLDMNLASA
jgi:LmbE family N-acetylglucosaminyl deacetylase